jgi:cation transport ATPase
MMMTGDNEATAKSVAETLALKNTLPIVFLKTK